LIEWVLRPFQLNYGYVEMDDENRNLTSTSRTMPG